MARFLSAIPPTMTTGLDLNNYTRVGGYLDKPGDKRECGIMQDIKIMCSSPSARSTLLDKLAELAKTVETTEDKEDAGVWTWMAFACLDDEVGARIFARFRSREDMERHIRRKEVVDFWLGSKEEVRSMGSRGYLPNGKGWLHR